MSNWRAYDDDGLWRFYKDGIELDWENSGHTIIDALNAAESRIAELEDFINQLIKVGHKSANFVEGFCNTYGNERPDYWHDWRKLEDDWKEREK